MTDTNNQEKKYKRIIAILLFIIAILIVWLIVEKSRMHTIVVEKTTTIAHNTELQSELDSLLNEHNKIKASYGELSGKLAEKDSVILANAGEIQKLIAIQGDYRKTKKKLELLRNITQGYLTQLDSLYRANQALTDENQKIKVDITNERKINTELSKDKQVLNEKVNLASQLKAYNVKASTVKLRSNGTKESETDKAKRVERVNICFTLSENKIASSGNKTIYIRIARPDNVIVCEGKDDIYTFEYQGQKIQYSMKKEISYDNKAQELCLSWNKKDDKIPAMVGKYNVAIFIDGYEIGQSQFELK
ncbi:MAG: hypothetical protein NTZ33_04020 [Bacteroidetes bacterium]|nr:hypothetical protein [Bacteroidota bacterium]